MLSPGTLSRSSEPPPTPACTLLPLLRHRQHWTLAGPHQCFWTRWCQKHCLTQDYTLHWADVTHTRQTPSFSFVVQGEKETWLWQRPPSRYLEVLDLLVGFVQLDPAEVLVQPVHQGHVGNRVHSQSCLELFFLLLPLRLSVFGQFVGVIVLPLRGTRARKICIELDVTAEPSLTPDTFAYFPADCSTQR